MPPSHAASRALLLVLVLAAAVALLLAGLDTTSWQRFDEQLQAMWSALRTAVQNSDASTALRRG